MATFRRSRFANAKVEIDGNVFIDCVFDNATLVYRGGAVPTFEGCSFRAPMFLGFEDAAGRTIGLLRAMYSGGMKPLVDTAIQAIQARTPPRSGVH